MYLQMSSSLMALMISVTIRPLISKREKYSSGQYWGLFWVLLSVNWGGRYPVSLHKRHISFMYWIEDQPPLYLQYEITNFSLTLPMIRLSNRSSIHPQRQNASQNSFFPSKFYSSNSTVYWMNTASYSSQTKAIRSEWNKKILSNSMQKRSINGRQASLKFSSISRIS